MYHFGKGMIWGIQIWNNIAESQALEKVSSMRFVIIAVENKGVSEVCQESKMDNVKQYFS